MAGSNGAVYVGSSLLEHRDVSLAWNSGLASLTEILIQPVVQKPPNGGQEESEAVAMAVLWKGLLASGEGMRGLEAAPVEW